LNSLHRRIIPLLLFLIISIVIFSDCGGESNVRVFPSTTPYVEVMSTVTPVITPTSSEVRTPTSGAVMTPIPVIVNTSTPVAVKTVTPAPVIVPTSGGPGIIVIINKL